MGDLNSRSDSPEMAVLLENVGLLEPAPGLHTFPSWQPDRQLDHILVSPSITVEQVEVLDCTFSDHRPLSMAVRLPAAVRLEPEIPHIFPNPVDAAETLYPLAMQVAH